MRNKQKTNRLHDDDTVFRISQTLNEKTDFTREKKIQKIFIDYSKTMKKNEKTNDKTKNHNQFNRFDVFRFESMIQKRHFHRINNSVRNKSRTRDETTHRIIVR